jgi:hypothetical protein
MPLPSLSGTRAVAVAACACAAAAGCTATADEAPPPAGPDAVEQAAGSTPPITPLSVERARLPNGRMMRFAVVLPPGYAPGDEFPIAVALPPGDQALPITHNVTRDLYREAARERGWIVISPVAPEGRLFFDGAERLIPSLLVAVAERYRPEGDRFHLIGMSNGGVSAFRLALDRPGLFHSLVVFPGYARGAPEMARLDRLRRVPVRMFVGREDRAWLSSVRATHTALRAAGADANLRVEPGDGHIIAGLSGDRLFALLEGLRPEEPEPDPEPGADNAVVPSRRVPWGIV